MATSITPTTAQAQRKVFQLLEDNFDTGDGQYLHGYDDARIAKETNISENAVKEIRTGAFGKLKPPTDFHKLKMDLDQVETAFLKLDNEFRAQIKDLKARVQIMQRRFD